MIEQCVCVVGEGGVLVRFNSAAAGLHGYCCAEEEVGWRPNKQEAQRLHWGAQGHRLVVDPHYNHEIIQCKVFVCVWGLFCLWLIVSVTEDPRRMGSDYYIYIFMVEFVAFVYFIFAYQSVGSLVSIFNSSGFAVFNHLYTQEVTHFRYLLEVERTWVNWRLKTFYHGASYTTLSSLWASTWPSHSFHYNHTITVLSRCRHWRSSSPWSVWTVRCIWLDPSSAKPCFSSSRSLFSTTSSSSPSPSVSSHYCYMYMYIRCIVVLSTIVANDKRVIWLLTL